MTYLASTEYWRDLEVCVMDRSRSVKMVPIDTTYYWSAILTITLSCTVPVFELFDVE